MSKIKKSLPTIVGGAMLLTNASVFATNELINQEGDSIKNQEVEKELVSEDIPVESEDIVVDVVEDVEDKNNQGQVPEIKDSLDNMNNKDSEKEEESKENEQVKNDGSSKITHEEMINLLTDIKSASQQKVMIVKDESISVREGSDLSSTEVGKLKKGDYVDVYEQNSALGWSKINYEGKMSYVNTASLIDVDKAYKETSEEDVIVRSGAGDTYNEFGKLKKGTRVQVYQILENGWSKINYENKIAFVETSKLVDTYSSEAVVLVDKVVVYKTASDSSEKIGEYLKNAKVLIYGEEGSYYKVKFGDNFGYIKKSDLELVKNTEKPQTGDAMVFSYMGALGVSAIGLVTVNRKRKNK